MKRLMVTMVLIATAGYTLILLYFPVPLLNPAELTEGHRSIESDCFACHTAFIGLPKGKCIRCHAVEQIGILTTTGIPKNNQRTSFHAHLETPECMTCHTDHSGREAQPAVFQHKAIIDSLEKKCSSCHIRPEDAVHKKISGECGLCHSTEAWKPAHFDHSTMSPDSRNQCSNCHKKPIDSMHLSIETACGTCHSTERWKPAAFDHVRYFVFDNDHRTECATCHKDQDYKKYTCYGCHEHTSSKIRDEHIEEGISDFENCVRCHRSGDKHEAKQETRKNREKHDNDDD